MDKTISIKQSSSAQEAYRFLDSLDPCGISFAFQIIDDDKERAKQSKIEHHGRDPRARTIHGTPPRCWDALVKANRDRCGVFVTINETAPNAARTRRNVRGVRKHFIEMDDDAAPLAEVKAGQLKPAMIVESSPGRFHTYWNVAPDVAADLTGFTRRQLQLAVKFKADRSAADLPRVLRVPGFLHQKKEPFRVRIVFEDPEAPLYSIADFDEALADIVVPETVHGERSETLAADEDDMAIERAREYFSETAPSAISDTVNDKTGKKGNDTTYQVMCWARDLGVTAPTCLSLALEHYNPRCDPEWSDEELAAIVDHAYRYAQGTQGEKSAVAELAKEPLDPPTPEDLKAAKAVEAALSSRQQFEKALGRYVGCLDPVSFIVRERKKLVSKEHFNSKYNPLINRINKLPSRYLDNAAKYALATDVLERVDGVCYRPGEPDFCKGANDGDRLFNMWIDPGVEPLAELPKIFLAHMDYLIPDKRERELALNYLAWMIQRPSDKLMFALLIVDAGGTGKSWLGLMLRALLGAENVALISDEDPIKEIFNGWTENKQVGFINELVPDAKTDIAARLKGVITEDTLNVRHLYVGRYKAENRCNIVAATNHPNAIKITRQDRRWLVVRGADDPYGVDDNGEATAETMAYYKRLFDCVGKPGDEIRRILWWLRRRDLTGFDGKSLAPLTEMRTEVADSRLTDIEATVIEAHRARSEPFTNPIITPADVLKGLAISYRGDEQAALVLIAAAMRTAGCRRIGEGKQVKIGGKPFRLWAMTKKLAAEYAKLKGTDLAKAYQGQAKRVAGREDPTDFAYPI